MDSKDWKQNPIFFYAMILLSMVFWGSSWVSSKLMVADISPAILVFWRFVFTFISFIPLVFIFKADLKLNRVSFLWLAGSAILLCIYYALFFKGLITAMPGAAGVLLTTTSPLFTFLISGLFYQRRFEKKDFLGLLLGLAGGLILLKFWSWNFGDIVRSGNFIILIAGVVWSLFTIFGQKAQKNQGLFAYSFWLYAFSTFLSFIFAVPAGAFQLKAIPFFVWANLIYLAIFSTTFANTVYLLGSKRLGAHKVGSFMFLVPVNALLFSFIFMHEIPAWYTLAGGVIAMAAVYIIQYRKSA